MVGEAVRPMIADVRQTVRGRKSENGIGYDTLARVTCRAVVLSGPCCRDIDRPSGVQPRFVVIMRPTLFRA
ncbi:hypothetical protein AGR8A_pAt20241 [Agrobacterium fabrum str. J-07]|nr:hypothetical protein AGR8A_pAt20241 [Agrobacterium fabrum str. J-07]